jgi:hypothetical protein
MKICLDSSTVILIKSPTDISSGRSPSFSISMSLIPTLCMNLASELGLAG